MGAQVSSTAYNVAEDGKAAGKEADEHAPTKCIAALKELQQTLHTLTPAEQYEVKRQLGFATTEWQHGLSLSLNPVKPAFGESVHGEANFAAAAAGEKLSAVQQRINLTPDAEKIVLVLVGLPARGKSSYGHKLEQFLAWRGYKTKMFKVGAWRRGEREGQVEKVNAGPSPVVKRRGLGGLADYAAEEAPPTPTKSRAQYSSASFFDSTKAFAAATREKVTTDAFVELLSWLEKSRGQIAIFDACNVTIARRAKLVEMINKHAAKHRGSPIGTVFIESICTDAEVIQREMGIKIALSNDFKGMAAEAAMQDLSDRIAHYEATYQTVREAEGAYIKIFDMRAKVHACNIYGRMAKSIMPFIMAVHHLARPIFVLSVDESAERPGALQADGSLAPGLTRWLSTYERAHEVQVLSSTQPRAKALAAAFAAAAGAPPPACRPTLAPLQQTDEDVDAEATGETFRRAFGERVSDLVMRLEPLVLELEGSTSPVLVVAHEGACRALRTYVLNLAARQSIVEREQVDGTIDMGAPVLREFASEIVGGLVTERVHDYAC